MNMEDVRWRDLATYPFRWDVTCRIGDMDGYGHLNGMRLGFYYEEARAAFYQDAFGDIRSARFLVAEMTMRYLAEGYWPGTLQLGTATSKIGVSSFQMAQALFQRDRCIGLGRTVLVHVPGRSSEPIGSHVREQLQRAAALL